MARRKRHRESFSIGSGTPPAVRRRVAPARPATPVPQAEKPKPPPPAVVEEKFDRSEDDTKPTRTRKKKKV